MATTQEVELVTRQLEEFHAQMDEMRQQSTNAAMNAAVTGLTDAVSESNESFGEKKKRVQRIRESRSQTEPYALGKDFDDWDFTFNGCAGTLDPAIQPC